VQDQQQQEQKCQGKLKKYEVDGNATHIGNDDVSITSNATSLRALDLMSTV
jgi:hypothetical protein